MLKGIIPMTYCFFNKNNSIDMQAMRDQISLIKQLGSHGIACLGLATEVNKLNFSEKKKIIELVAGVSNDRLPIVVTISGNNINEYKKLIEVAAKFDCDAVKFQKKNVEKKITSRISRRIRSRITNIKGRRSTIISGVPSVIFIIFLKCQSREACNLQ